MPDMTPLKIRFARGAAFSAALFVTLTCTSPLVSAAADPVFADAVKEYRLGRWSSAYARFFMAANNGNPHAARIALFMYTHGPMLYGTPWDASSEDVELWSRLDRSARQPGMDMAQPNLASFTPEPQPTRGAYKPRMTRFVGRGLAAN
jgi:hypothetical protein